MSIIENNIQEYIPLKDSHKCFNLVELYTLYEVYIRLTQSIFSVLQMSKEDKLSKMGDCINIAYTFLSDEEVDKVSIPDESMALHCEGISQRLWMSKCMILNKVVGVLVAKRIHRNVNSDVVVGSSGLLGDNHVAI